MNTKILKYVVNRTVILSLISLFLSNCSSLNSISTEINFFRKRNKSNNILNNILTVIPLKTDTVTVTTHDIQSMTTSLKIPQLKIQSDQFTRNVPILKTMRTKSGCIARNRKYVDILKGSYTGGNIYSVKNGDTLFYIAWITGNNFHDLAKKNNITAPYNLYINQKIQLGKVSVNNLTFNNYINLRDNMKIKKNGAVIVYRSTDMNFVADKKNTKNIFLKDRKEKTFIKTPSSIYNAHSRKNILVNRSYNSSMPVWKWPTEGNIVEYFSPSEGGNKGIDIIGNKGQSVVATANGRIVYAGNALRGYRNLIIIKHNDDYLSAYAHNDTILVHEQQEVKEGQKISTMGSFGNNPARLHFEIRYKGKSINPLKYLPKR